MQPFVAFIPLSNWLHGFDRYAMRYSKALLPASTYPDAFYMLHEKESWEPGLRKTQRLIEKLAREKDRIVALRALLPVGPEGMQPNTVTGTGIGWRWPSPEIPLSGVAWVNADGTLLPTRHEQVTAEAFRLSTTGLLSWASCRPRSLSVLPVAKACEARCNFCFSKASVSDIARQQQLSIEHVHAWIRYAKQRGAERAVITGGGEPTLWAWEPLLAVVRALAESFASVLLISNGSRLTAERIAQLRAAGLTTLALSRHGATLEHDAAIMGIAVPSAVLAQQARACGLRTRSICVLQQGGIENEEDVLEYVERCARDGFDEVCFKELYVSSLSENPWAPSAVNRYCEEKQVPLVTVLRAMQQAGFVQQTKLPWGSPVFEGTIANRSLRVAAYTEPSVGWERTHGLVRSWNLLSDGSCVASLEDPSSVLSLPSSEDA